ncbi:zeta toxin family protein [Paenibacillus peoriae]|uniref:zeta toxin family protein n=1 Tax=Paenibacillus peoriae TaxID=59893 RepID=UPI00026C6881|nr:zeta toxin family protein [Paenibacillus peoriae]MEC0182311.1 zeta toxin family protein [Paenibacillus peoriae]
MNKPVMTVFAGTNGAGKSTLTKQLVSQIGEVIDPDAIAKSINPVNPESVSPAAGRETLNRVKECIRAGKSFSIETTLSGKTAIRQMEQAKAAGFEVDLYYVGLKNVEYHISRVEMRVAQGGHFIPEEDIRRRYDRSLTNLAIASKIADRTYVFDNTSEFTQLLEIERGQVHYFVDKLPEWARRSFDSRSTLAEKLNRLKPLVDKHEAERKPKGRDELER